MKNSMSIEVEIFPNKDVKIICFHGVARSFPAGYARTSGEAFELSKTLSRVSCLRSLSNSSGLFKRGTEILVVDKRYSQSSFQIAMRFIKKAGRRLTELKKAKSSIRTTLYI